MLRNCEQCGVEFTAKTARGIYCSTRCRTRATRARQQNGGTAPVVTLRPTSSAPVVAQAGPTLMVSGLVESVRAALEKAGRLDDWTGQNALELAATLSSPLTLPNAKAGLSRALAEAMGAAMQGVKVGDELDEILDELAEQRARRGSGA